CPGFVGNRIANSAISEIWRAQEESGATPEEVDKLVSEAKVLPMGPFFLTDQLGLDTVLHVAEHLRESYGDRFYVHKQMKELVESLERAQSEWGDAFEPPLILRRLVAQGRLGQKSGQGFFPYARPDDGFDQGETVKLETRGDAAIAWLENPPANSISPQLIR